MGARVSAGCKQQSGRQPVPVAAGHDKSNFN
jgi:hypothetical protein